MPRSLKKYHNLYAWLRESGGSRNAAVDGSSTAVLFEYEALEIRTSVERMIISIVDNGSHDAALYGNGLILTNGIKVEIVDTEGDVHLDLMDGETIKSNGDWHGVCYDYTYHDIGQGDNIGTVRWTFGKTGEPLELYAGEILRVTIQDDLTALTSHTFSIQGILT